MKYVVAGTAGHIDHGKSALVKALTGTDPDRLEEEKRRGITIDLGFAHLDLGDVQAGFVDVPGHEKFVKNMLAGVGGIDFVLLVVAADESVMPQTREHFEICRLLGIPAGIVVLTKTDLVDAELLELVTDEVRDMARGSFLEGAPVVPVSSKTGEGIDRLRDSILNISRSIPSRQSDRVLRLPVDRAFTIRGFGTVVTGTLLTGEIRKDAEVELVPDSLTTRVRGLQVHGRPTDVAVAGQRTAVNLQGIDLDQVQRGMVLTVPRQFRPGPLLDVHLTLLPSSAPLRTLRKVRFHHGTSEVLARVALLGPETLKGGGSCFAQLRLDQPVFCLHGDRFIIRQFSPAVTIGGGTVLHPAPEKHKATDKGAVEILEGLSTAHPRERIPLLLRSRKAASMTARELNASLGLPDVALQKMIREASSEGLVAVVPAPDPILLLPGTLRELGHQSLSAIREFHRQNPLQRGMSREELRKRVFDAVPLEVFRHCLDSLAASQEVSLLDEAVSLHGREVQLTDDEKRLEEEIRALYVRTGNQAPLLPEIQAAIQSDADRVRKIYFWLIKERVLVRITEDLAYPRETLEEIKARIRQKYSSGQKFGVAEFKELFDLTRKHAIPLLEFLDREHFTRRQGNDRVLL
jgi:selenocysteine-specific elongation factor